MIKNIRWFLLAGSFCLLTGCLSHAVFQGGTLNKGPFFSYPRYVAQLPEFDLNKNGQYAASLRGFPASPAWIDIDLIGRTGGDRELLERFTTAITMELDAADGTRVCKAEGKLNKVKGSGDHHWVVSYSNADASFWNSDCGQLKIRSNQSYTLKITVENATEDLGVLLARPRLMGGGHERCC